jgi:hypothetical protein
MMGQFGIWLANILNPPKTAASLPPPFITTVCPDCGAVIVWQGPVIAGTGVLQICVCQAHWVAVAPAVTFLREKEFLKAYGLAGESATLGG